MRQAQKMMCSAITEAAERAKAAGYTTSDWKNDRFCPRIIKLDISGYFMALPRAKVYERVSFGLSKQFGEYLGDKNVFRIYKICEFLWQQVIFDDPVTKAIKWGDLRRWESGILPTRKSLFCQPPRYGLVIGNLTSQLCSNIYLDQLDKFITEELGYKRYGRYVDDFFMVVQGEEYKQAKQNVKAIEKFLKDELELTLHPKKRYYQQVYKGMSFVGARIYPHCLYPSDRLQKKTRNGVVNFASGHAKMETVKSYLGFMSKLDGKKFLEEVFDTVGW